MDAIEVLALEEKSKVQELYLTALVYVTIAFLEAEDSHKKEMKPVIAELVQAFQRDPIKTGANLHAAGFFCAAVIFGVAVGSPIVMPVVATVSLVLGAVNFYENNIR